MFLILVEPNSIEISTLSSISSILLSNLKNLTKWDKDSINNVFLATNQQVKENSKNEKEIGFVSFSMIQPSSHPKSFECIGGQSGLSRGWIGRKDDSFISLSDHSKHETNQYNPFSQEYRNSSFGIGNLPNCEPHVSDIVNLTDGEFVFLCTSSFFGKGHFSEEELLKFIHKKLRETNDVQLTLESLFFYYQNHTSLRELNNIGAVLLHLTSPKEEAIITTQPKIDIFPPPVELLSEGTEVDSSLGEYFHLVESFQHTLNSATIQTLFQTRIRYLNFLQDQIESQYTSQIQEKLGFLKDLDNLKHVGILFEMKDRVLPKLEKMK